MTIRFKDFKFKTNKLKEEYCFYEMDNNYAALIIEQSPRKPNGLYKVTIKVKEPNGEYSLRHDIKQPNSLYKEEVTKFMRDIEEFPIKNTQEDLSIKNTLELTDIDEALFMDHMVIKQKSGNWVVKKSMGSLGSSFHLSKLLDPMNWKKIPAPIISNQSKWIEKENIHVGDCVVVTREPNGYSDPESNPWNKHKEACVGNYFRINGTGNTNGIEVKTAVKCQYFPINRLMKYILPEIGMIFRLKENAYTTRMVVGINEKTVSFSDNNISFKDLANEWEQVLESEE